MARRVLLAAMAESWAAVAPSCSFQTEDIYMALEHPIGSEGIIYHHNERRQAHMSSALT